MQVIANSAVCGMFRFQVVRWTKTARNSGLNGIKKPNRYPLLVPATLQSSASSVTVI